MAMIETSTRLPFGALTVHRLVSAVDAALLPVARWIQVRRTAEMLRQLDDHRLDDLGLSRADVEHFAEHGRF